MALAAATLLFRFFYLVLNKDSTEISTTVSPTTVSKPIFCGSNGENDIFAENGQECCSEIVYERDESVDTSVVEYPRHDENTAIIYVDSVNGNNNNDGFSENSALKTLAQACSNLQDNSLVYVKNGTYRNWKWGVEGELMNPAVCQIKNVKDIEITAFPGHKPKIEFDGSGGISMTNVERAYIHDLRSKDRIIEFPSRKRWNTG